MILTALQILSSNAIFNTVYFLKYRYFFTQRPQRYLYGRVKISGGSRPSGKGGGGCGHPDPEIRGGGGRPQKKFFSARRALFWSKNKGEMRAPPLDPPLRIPGRAFKGSLG